MLPRDDEPLPLVGRRDCLDGNGDVDNAGQSAEYFDSRRPEIVDSPLDQ